MSRLFARKAGDARPGEPADPSADTAVLPAAPAPDSAPSPVSDRPLPVADEEGPARAEEGAEAAVPEAPASFRDRAQARRRARYLRKVHELGLRDLGGLVLDLHRFGRERGDLVEAKLAALQRTHDELRALEELLGARRPVTELREPGLGGACPSCGGLHGSADAFCSSCGHALAGEGSP